jgi:hypothetical protein
MSGHARSQSSGSVGAAPAPAPAPAPAAGAGQGRQRSGSSVSGHGRHQSAGSMDDLALCDAERGDTVETGPLALKSTLSFVPEAFEAARGEDGSLPASPLPVSSQSQSQRPLLRPLSLLTVEEQQAQAQHEHVHVHEQRGFQREVSLGPEELPAVAGLVRAVSAPLDCDGDNDGDADSEAGPASPSASEAPGSAFSAEAGLHSPPHAPGSSSKRNKLLRPQSMNLMSNFGEEDGVHKWCNARRAGIVVAAVLLLSTVIAMAVVFSRPSGSGSQPVAGGACVYSAAAAGGASYTGDQYCSVLSSPAASGAAWECAGTTCSLQQGGLSFPLLKASGAAGSGSTSSTPSLVMKPYFAGCPAALSAALSAGEPLLGALAKLSNEALVCPRARGATRVQLERLVFVGGSPLLLAGAASGGFATLTSVFGSPPANASLVLRAEPAGQRRRALDRWRGGLSLSNGDGSALLSLVQLQGTASAKPIFMFAWLAAGARNAQAQSFAIVGDDAGTWARLRFSSLEEGDFDLCFSARTSGYKLLLEAAPAGQPAPASSSCEVALQALNEDPADQVDPFAGAYEVEATAAPSPESPTTTGPSPAPTTSPTWTLNPWPPMPGVSCFMQGPLGTCKASNRLQETPCRTYDFAPCVSLQQCREACANSTCSAIRAGFNQETGTTNCTLLVVAGDGPGVLPGPGGLRAAATKRPTKFLTSRPTTAAPHATVNEGCIVNQPVAVGQTCREDKCFSQLDFPCGPMSTGRFIWGLEIDMCKVLCLGDPSCTGVGPADASSRDVGCTVFSRPLATSGNMALGQCWKRSCGLH